MKYPDAPGYKRAGTSSDAANDMKRHVRYLKAQVVKALQKKQMTADECSLYIDADRLAIRPRFSELRNAGRITDTGKRRKNESGKWAIVWKLI